LINEPEIIFLDEPTLGLDPKGQQDIRKLLLDINHDKGVTIFLSSHNLNDVASICNRIAIINRGTLIAQGTLNELRKLVGGVESVVITLVNSSSLDVVGQLSKMGYSFNVKPENCNKFIDVFVSDTTQESINGILDNFSKGGLELYEVRRFEMTLEDIFFKLTESETKKNIRRKFIECLPRFRNKGSFGKCRLKNLQMKLYRHEIYAGFYSWRASGWLIAAALIFSLVAYLLLTDKELSLLDQGEMLFTLAQVVLALGIVMSAIIASSILSSEIESGTFESLLLTPITHRRIATEKMISVITIWRMLYLVSIPYLIIVASGTSLGMSAVLNVGLYGTLFVSAISMISVTISWKLKSSKNSIMITMMIVLLMLAPSLFFGSSLKTDFGIALENINPVSHAVNSLDSVLVDNEQSLSQQFPHIWPVILFTGTCYLIFIYYTKHFEVKNPE
jgi:ABC-type transport system involved in multi-copper enzyme maturation permease subunit